jgi:mannose-6-phosphate isomerase-like protein (cupin superfamily)
VAPSYRRMSNEWPLSVRGDYDTGMITVDRRDFCWWIALAGCAAAKPLSAQAAPIFGQGTLGGARVIPLESMEERKTATGMSWNIAHGMLAGGETVSLHQSMQVAGAPPVQIHSIEHTEFVLLSEGEVEFAHEVDGKVVVEHAAAGSVLYIPPGTRHAVHNSGTAPARYFVVAIGGDAK